jgi:hypothetical protein
MNTAVTLTAEEFTRIHNALCFARSQGLEATVDAIRDALQGAYHQDGAAIDRKMNYFRGFQDEHKLEAIWSMYELNEHCFLQDHPYSSDAFVCYQGRHVPVSGVTWGDVYRAANQAILISGDLHHIFIEGFDVRNGNELHLVTGS